MNNIAVIDIGSGSTKMSLFERTGNQIHLLKTWFRDLRLKDIGETEISPQTIQVLQNTLQEYIQAVDDLGIQALTIIGTEALRASQCRDEICQKIQVSTGKNIRVLSGTQEAAYLLEAVRYEAHQHHTTSFLAMDIGAGSLEFNLEEDGKFKTSASFPLGIIAVASRLHLEEELKISSQNIEQIYGEVQRFLSDPPFPQPSRGTILIGTGGNFWSIRQLLSLPPYQALHLPALKTLAQELSGLSYEERKSLKKLPLHRCDFAPLGLWIALAAMEFFAYEQILPIEANLRLGVALSLGYI
jgi:exopolyphosphatase/guanosine-5'-triphosphate,3'-diphosphate pyrophosphatase